MHPEDVLIHPAVRLGDSERRSCFTNGFPSLDSAISSEWIARLHAATRDVIERSRAITESNGACVLEEGHSAETPPAASPDEPRSAPCPGPDVLRATSW